MSTDAFAGGATGTPDLDGFIADGRRHRAAGRFAEAEFVFSAAHAAFPDDARPLIQRGAVRVLVGRYAEALTGYADARRLDNVFPGLDSYVAEVYLYTGRPREALVISKAAVAREPADLMHRINVAHAHLQLGDVGVAFGLYRGLADEIHPKKGRTGRELVLEDLRLMDAAGVELTDIARVRSLLQSGKR